MAGIIICRGSPPRHWYEAISLGHVANMFNHFDISHARCTVINWPAQLPREGCYFVLIQSNQKSSRQKGFFASQGLCLQTGQNHGLESFAPLHSLLPSLQQNFLCLYRAQGHHRSARFRPKLFCRRGRKVVETRSIASLHYHIP
jgi:hypothetical protein